MQSMHYPVDRSRSTSLATQFIDRIFGDANSKGTSHAAAVQSLLDQARRSGESKSAQKLHHIVPSFYLKRWADDGKLRVINLDEHRSWPATPRKAATETDYYKLESVDLDPEEVPPLLYEVVLGKVEAWGAGFINAALHDPIATLRDDEQRVLFSIYLAFQYVRGRRYRPLRTHPPRIVSSSLMAR